MPDKKLDLKEVEKGASLKKAPTTKESGAVSDHTKLMGAIKNPKAKPELKKVDKPKDGLSKAEIEAYKKAKESAKK
ncbi:hypothetical protein AAMO2058_001027300 [Amorphochlora amoebiformis]|eukprot:1393079-Amorphochlora_amoeboformis.AAC.1